MSQFGNAYSYDHWKIVVDIMTYVFNTKEYKLNLQTLKVQVWFHILTQTGK